MSLVTGASGGVQDPWALVRTAHCAAQVGRVDARRVTAWAEKMGVRRAMREAMRKDFIVRCESGLNVSGMGCRESN